MEPETSPNHSYQHFGYGGAVISEKQLYNTVRKKSKVRLNDQLIPKPTDINMLEKMIKIPTPKQHPYSSHISKFAMFPSFCCPDDPETGVRAASQPFLSPSIPNSAPNVTLLSKTIGSPYRREVLETPMKTRKKAVMWAGEHGFMDHVKPLKGENQIFYPTPPKTVLPNPKLRDWDSSLSVRTSNMLKNLERTHWITSYQMHHTGSGPANPLKIDDFTETICERSRMNSHAAPLRERSIPLFVPSKPRGGCRRRHGSTCSLTAAELTNPSPAPNTGISSATSQQRPLEITARFNEAPDPNQRGHSQSENSSGSKAQSIELSQEVLHTQQTGSKSSVNESKARENCRVQFEESPMRVSMSQSCQEANAARIAGTERPLDPSSRPHPQEEVEVNREKSLTKMCVNDKPSTKKEYFKAGKDESGIHQSSVAKDLAGIESHAELSSRSAAAQEKLQAMDREPPCSMCNPCILPRPPVLPGIHPVDRAGTVGREGTALCLLELQNAFSKTKAHRDFNSSITHAAVNLRDNVHTGKKHNFYGINCYYLHG